MRRARLLRGALLFLTGALIAAAVALAASGGSDQIRRTSVSNGTPILGIRPTGVGLPLVGGTGTIGAADLAPLLKAYHDSGQYEKDLTAVDARAVRYLALRLHQMAAHRGHCRGSGVATASRRPLRMAQARPRPRHRRDLALQLRLPR